MKEEMIPVAHPGLWFGLHREEVMEAIGRVVPGNSYILGENVQLFEEEFAPIAGCRYAAGVASGTEAIVLALKALGIRPGDEVITVSHTAVATVAAIEQAGAVPVLADIDPGSRCLDPGCLAGLLSIRTKAIVPVHIYGHPADMDAILEFASNYGLAVLEDCAQAHGAELKGRLAGSIGHAAAFSFYPTKNIGAMGDGGAVTSNMPELIEKVRTMREYGFSARRHISEVPGMNSRLDELQAAILRIRLRYFSEDMKRRTAIAQSYLEQLREVSGIRLPQRAADTIHAFHLFVLECDQREEWAAYLEQHGIATARHYPLPVHLQPAYKGRLKGSDRLGVTEEFYGKLLTIPLYPELSDSQAEYICQVIKNR